MTDTSLKGRRAVVTGGSRGIGLAVVEALAARGAEVLFTARNAEGIEAATAALPRGLNARGIVCDVTDLERMKALLADPIDILINNAGVIGPIARIAEVDLADWAENHRVNVLSAFGAIRLALPGLIRRKGTIVNLSSGAAFNPMEGWSAYCAGKAALAMITRCVHLEYGGAGVRAFGFAPGLVDTDMQAAIRASGVNPVSALPRESLRPASEPGQAIAWLCTPEADDLAGTDLDIRNATLRYRCGLEPIA
jgi:NAD(P)-dependent dehydrogenase (short-subunit alcohol dehydrogenase family)